MRGHHCDIQPQKAHLLPYYRLCTAFERTNISIILHYYAETFSKE